MIEINIIETLFIAIAAAFAGYAYGRITTQKKCEKSFFRRGCKR